MLTDNSPMPFGIHRGEALANVPAKYLLFLYKEGKLTPELRRYIESNMAVLKMEVENDKKKKR